MKKEDRKLVVGFLLAATIMYCIIFLYPILRTIVMSFFRVSDLTGPVSKWEFVGIENYKNVFSVKLFITSLKNIFHLWLYGGIISLGAALIFAVILNSGIKGKKFFKSVLYVPHIVSAVALATMWIQYIFNARYGFLKDLFTGLGWERLASIQWLDGDHKFGAMLISYCFGVVGYYALIFSSGIEKIPSDYYEASTIDGANKISQFFKITLPLITGEIKTTLTMWSISALGFMMWGQLFSTVNEDISTISPMIYMYLQTFGATDGYIERNAGEGAVIGVFLGVTVGIIFAIINKIFSKREDYEL